MVADRAIHHRITRGCTMKDEASVLEIDRITQVLQRRCEDMGVTLEWSQYASTPMTGHTTKMQKKVILPAIHHPVTRSAMDKIYGFVVHEAGHHSRPEAFSILEALPNDTSEALHALFNIAEDDGMERDLATTYRGDAVALGKSNDRILKEITKVWAGRPIPEEATEQDLAPMAVCGIAQLSRTTWDGWSNEGRARFFDSLPPVAKGLMETLAQEGWAKRLQDTETPHDTWDVACDLYKRLYPEADEDEVEEQRAKGHSMEPCTEDSESTDSSGAESGDTESEGGDSTGDMEDKHGDAKDATKGKPGDQGQVISWKDAVLSEHDEWKPKEDGAQPGNIGIDWTDYQRGQVCLMPQNMINVMDCRNNTFKVEPDGGWGGSCGTPESFMPDNKNSRAFGNQIRRYLQAQRRTRVRRERYHGKLDKGSIVKLALPPIDGGEYNKRIFYDHSRRKELDTCIHVLTDWSGSMQGDKMVHAADASGRLVYVFDRVLRVPVQLAAFTNGRTRCDIGLIKGFNDRSISPKNIAENFSKFYKFSSANNDADAVMWAYNQLLRRKEERKILIVLSDGCPAGSWAGSSSTNLSHVTKHIQDEGEIELYGVGICSSAVETYYKNSKVLNDETEINKTLFEIIKEGAYK